MSSHSLFTNHIYCVVLPMILMMAALLLPGVISTDLHLSPSSQRNAEEDTAFFNLDLKNQVAKLNSNYKMKCSLNLAGVIFWTVDSRVPDGSKFKILSDSNLLIRNVSRDDFDREYLCHALIPGKNMVRSMQISLQSSLQMNRDGKGLNVPPQNNIALSSVEKNKPHSKTNTIFALVGTQQTLSCQVQARPSPKFTWLYRNGTIIQNQTEFVITTNSEHGISNLTIFLRDASTHYGTYICEAWNTLGKSEQMFILQMPPKPRDVPFLYPKVIGSRRMLLGLSFTNPPKRNYSRVYIQYRKIWDVLWNGTSTDGNAGNAELNNLERNTTYVVRAAVRNEYVLGDYSNPIHVTTDKEIQDEDEVNNNLEPLPLTSSGRSLHLDEPLLHNDNNASSSPGFGFTSKVVESRALSSKYVTKVGDKFIITTNTSTVEEVWSGIENYEK